MIKKLCVVLLVLIILLGPVGGFWSKPARANTGSERRVMLCAAWPWEDGGWSSATSPSSSDSDSTYSSANPTKPGDKVEPQRVQQKPQKSFWSRLQFFLFNLKLLFGSK